MQLFSQLQCFVRRTSVNLQQHVEKGTADRPGLEMKDFKAELGCKTFLNILSNSARNLQLRNGALEKLQYYKVVLLNKQGKFYAKSGGVALVLNSGQRIC